MVLELRFANPRLIRKGLWGNKLNEMKWKLYVHLMTCNWTKNTNANKFWTHNSENTYMPWGLLQTMFTYFEGIKKTTLNLRSDLNSEYELMSDQTMKISITFPSTILVERHFLYNAITTVASCTWPRMKWYLACFKGSLT